MIYRHYFYSILFTLSAYSMQDDTRDFMRAAHTGDEPTMQQLMQKKLPQATLAAALYSAIKTYNFTTCSFLITQTELTGNEIVEGYSLISHAMRNQNETATTLLLDKPGLNFKQSINGITLVEALAQNGYAGLLNAVLKKNIFSPQECKRALMVATINGKENTVAELLNAGVSARDFPLNKTPLHQAVEAAKSKITIIELLLKADSIVDQEDQNGLTPLYHAVNKSRRNVAKLLVTHGADIKKSRACAEKIHDLGVINKLNKWFNLPN